MQVYSRELRYWGLYDLHVPALSSLSALPSPSLRWILFCHFFFYSYFLIWCLLLPIFKGVPLASILFFIFSGVLFPNLPGLFLFETEKNKVKDGKERNDGSRYGRREVVDMEHINSCHQVGGWPASDPIPAATVTHTARQPQLCLHSNTKLSRALHHTVFIHSHAYWQNRVSIPNSKRSITTRATFSSEPKSRSGEGSGRGWRKQDPRWRIILNVAPGLMFSCCADPRKCLVDALVPSAGTTTHDQ